MDEANLMSSNLCARVRATVSDDTASHRTPSGGALERAALGARVLLTSRPMHTTHR